MADVFPLVRPDTIGGVRNLAEATDVLLAGTVDRATAGAFNLCTATATTLNVGSATCAVDLDGLTVDILSAGVFSIDGTGASNVSATSGNLTLSTITTGSLLLNTSAAGNIGINQSTFATSELGCLAIHSGTLPTAAWPADCAHIGVADRGGVADKASVHIFAQDGTGHVFGDLVGIGTIAPTSKLHVMGTPSDTVNSANSISKIGGNYSGAVSINFGQLNGTPNYNSWIQSMRETDDTAFNLALQPLGGHVGIGTLAPAYKLDVAGDVNVASGSAYKYNGVNVILAQTALDNFYFGRSGNLTGSGSYNSGIGPQSLVALTTGEQNIAHGLNALGGNTDGTHNIGIGTFAGLYAVGPVNNASSTHSIYIGHLTYALASGDANEIVIGDQAVGAGSNTVTLGNASITKTLLQGNVGINKAVPAAMLDVNYAAGGSGTIARFGYTGGSDYLRVGAYANYAEVVAETSYLLLGSTTATLFYINSVPAAILNAGNFSLSTSVGIQKAGTAKSITNLLELTNTYNAADMDGTGVGILFNLFAYDAVTPVVADAGCIAIVAESDWLASDATTQDSYMSLQTALNGAVAEKLRITSGGNVGINKAVPAALLDVNYAAGGSGTIARFGYTGGSDYVRIGAEAGYSYLFAEVSQMIFGTTGANDLTFYTNTTPRVRINGSNGWLAVGNATASSYLDVEYAGTVTSTVNFLEITNTANAAAMTGTGTAILCNQWFYDAVTPAVADSGRLAWITEGNWTSAGATQNSYCSVQTCYQGTLTEALHLSSGGIMSVAKTIENTTIDIGYAEDGTAPPELENIVTQTNGVKRARVFSHSSEEDVRIGWRVPDDIVAASGIKFKVHGIITSSTAPAAGEGVSFKLSGYSRGTGDSLNGTFGTEVEASIVDLDAVGVNAQYDLFSTAYSGTVTVTDLAAGEWVEFHFERDTADSDDDYAQDLGVTGITVQWTRQLPAS